MAKAAARMKTAKKAAEFEDVDGIESSCGVDVRYGMKEDEGGTLNRRTYPMDLKP